MEESKILSCAWMWSEGSGEKYVFSKEALLDFARELLSLSQQDEQQSEQDRLGGLLEAALYYIPSNKTELRALIDAALSVQGESHE